MLEFASNHPQFDEVLELGALLSPRPRAVRCVSLMMDLGVSSVRLAQLIHRVERRGFAVLVDGIFTPTTTKALYPPSLEKPDRTVWVLAMSWPGLRAAVESYESAVYPSGRKVQRGAVSGVPGGLGMDSSMSAKGSGRGHDGAVCSRDVHEWADGQGVGR